VTGTTPAPISHSRGEVVSRAVSRILSGYLEEIDYFTRENQPGVLDFTFGDPREMAPQSYVSALRTAVTPQHEGWFAYKEYEPAAQEAAAASLAQLTGLPFEPDDILLTTGGFAALSVGMKAVADPGDEVIYSLPPWFAYETLLVEAGLVPVKVRLDLETLELEVDAIAATPPDARRCIPRHRTVTHAQRRAAMQDPYTAVGLPAPTTQSVGGSKPGPACLGHPHPRSSVARAGPAGGDAGARQL
jgi:aspartate aminotransferase